MVDVTVLGAGAFGLSVAWACLQRGAKVRVIDPYGVGAGSSGGVVGALAPHTPENWNDKKEFQFQSLIMAEAFWAEVEETGGVSSGYGRTGRLQPVLNDRGLELARARQETSGALWRGQAKWRVISEEDAGPWAPRTPTGFLIHDTLSARMHPRMACASLAAAIQEKGGEITKEAQHEGQVVWATGWQGLVSLSQDMGRMVGNGVKGQAALLRLDRPDLPQLFADSVHVVPHVDGTVAIGSTSEREFENPTSNDAQIDAVLERAFAAVPALKNAEVIERWAGVRPRAKSRAPMLGRHPLREGAFIANGGFKIGFGMAPKVGAVMADLILDGVDTIPDDFRPEASL
ncbi:FAD-binding oxidoreductase [Shimia thalassica]|uniref:NAD(P)/FAD-dependent oxidoreductase n=1 Tax=Shimia thalassica TaxID=1715693 RepID=UPI000C085386|nr:FAD-binding oxidoreductase [Shimia thalassica]MBU2942444.1 FAD-binding oxidoreductase [Shimia thalassica]MDO6504372.1 FAD-binding oxidoreductase [Shimia thalassica]PHO05447.1 FAD-dependent oxidoreductase [Rhodobacteraceae bacterium 4F10]